MEDINPSDNTLYNITKRCSVFPLAKPVIIKNEYKKLKIVINLSEKTDVSEERITKDVSTIIDVRQKMKEKNKWIQCKNPVRLSN